METITNTTEEKSYPTTPDEKGYYYETADDELMGLRMKKYDNGNLVMSTVLPSSGKTAVVRELRGIDTKEINRFTGGDAEKYQTASITVATTLDDQKQPFEIYDQMKLKDYQRLTIMYQRLNF